MSKELKKKSLRLLPSVDEVIRDFRLSELLAEGCPRGVVLDSVRVILAEERQRILSGDAMDAKIKKKDEYLDLVVLKSLATIGQALRHNLRRVINATGVVIHTNLGRSLLSRSAGQAVYEVVSGYSNLELDLDTGLRGSRYAPLEPLLTRLTGAQAALVVNNNAAAVLLALNTLAKGREVVVSRGQLVEIGGSFRIPEVMEQSGARLVEVGTTNKTHPDDYRRAVNENTALLLHVHTSNYRIVGFTSETTVPGIVAIGRECSLPVMSDLGSGFFVNLSSYGLPLEPRVQEIMGAGPDVVTFSGDKLLGGPQAGVIVGKRHIIEMMKKNPLTRALRIDKMTVAALEATLREYLYEEQKVIEEVPTLKMLTIAKSQLRKKALELASCLIDALGDRAEVKVGESTSAVGGGAMPTAALPTVVVTVRPRKISAGELQTALRRGEPAVMGRVQEDKLLLDVRTICDTEFHLLVEALASVLKQQKRGG